MSENKSPTWFMVVAILALLWNLAGVGAFVGQMMMTPEQMAAMSEAERMGYENYPMWAMIAFAIAVFAGSLGCVALLIKKAWAYEVFILSCVGIVVQNIYNIFILGAMDIHGPVAIVMPLFVLGVGIYLIILSKDAKAKGWIS